VKALVGFAGFGGVEIALREAALETVGIEKDPAIAEVNRVNRGHCLTADILDIDPIDYIGYELMHFSPPCPNFSSANHRKSENENDVDLARAIARFVVVGQPRFLTLENVWAYRHSWSWKIIYEALKAMGYGLDWWHLNAADYGVPQSRKRMIAIARWDGCIPSKPWQTHSKKGDLFTPPWIGWYEAIQDLLPYLPETKFAKWQMDKMPEKLSFFLLGQGERSLPKPVSAPADTVTANNNQTGIKAFLVNHNSTNLGLAKVAAPSFVVTASSSRSRAFIVNGGIAQGCVVSMSPRCLARFQDFPDHFILPGEPGLDENPILISGPRTNRELAIQGIGNALPPGLYRAVLRSLDIPQKE
jgi:site-specific DNA-cytosine methylase